MKKIVFAACMLVSAAAEAATQCIACEPGKYASGNNCYTCTEGYYCIGGIRKQCSSGMLCPAGTDIPKSAPAVNHYALSSFNLLANAPVGAACKTGNLDTGIYRVVLGGGNGGGVSNNGGRLIYNFYLPFGAAYYLCAGENGKTSDTLISSTAGGGGAGSFLRISKNGMSTFSQALMQQSYYIVAGGGGGAGGCNIAGRGGGGGGGGIGSGGNAGNGALGGKIYNGTPNSGSGRGGFGKTYGESGYCLKDNACVVIYSSSGLKCGGGAGGGGGGKGHDIVIDAGDSGEYECSGGAHGYGLSFDDGACDSNEACRDYYGDDDQFVTGEEGSNRWTSPYVNLLMQDGSVNRVFKPVFGGDGLGGASCSNQSGSNGKASHETNVPDPDSDTCTQCAKLYKLK